MTLSKQVVETRWSLRSFTAQAILWWFYDSFCSLHSSWTLQGALSSSLGANSLQCDKGSGCFQANLAEFWWILSVIMMGRKILFIGCINNFNWLRSPKCAFFCLAAKVANNASLANYASLQLSAKTGNKTSITWMTNFQQANISTSIV